MAHVGVARCVRLDCAYMRPLWGVYSVESMYMRALYGLYRGN